MSSPGDGSLTEFILILTLKKILMAAHSCKYNRDVCPTDKSQNQHGRKKKRKKNKNIKEKQRKSNNDLIFKRKSGIKMKPNTGKTMEEQKKDRKKAAFKIFFLRGGKTDDRSDVCFFF